MIKVDKKLDAKKQPNTRTSSSNMQDENKTNTIKCNVSKKDKKNHRKLKVIISIFIIILVLLILAFTVPYITLNVKLYSELKNTNEEFIKVNSYFRYILINSKVVEKYKEANKGIKITYKDSIYTIPSSNMQKAFDIELNIEENRIFDFENIKDIECLYIKNWYYSSVELKLPEYLATKEKLDIYTLNKEENSIEIYKKGCSINENGTLTIDAKEDVAGYIVIYVPLKDMAVENNADIIELSKGHETKLNIEFIPNNATSTEFKYVVNDNSKISVNNDTLVGNEIGDETINICSINNDVKKEIKIHISNYVNDIKFNSDVINLTVGNSYSLEYSIVPEDAENPNLAFSTNNENIATIDNLNIKAIAAGTCQITASTTEGASFSKSITINVANKPVITTTSNNVSGLTYIQGILIVNKTYALPSDYNPGVNAQALAAFNNMKNAAANEGISLWIASGFRSYSTQSGLYNRYVNTYGKETADTFSARPGHSEHQTGLAFDLNYIEDWFANTKEGIWLANNSYKYGFIIRYPADKQAITGYKYEPWHIRYLGVDVATKVYNSGLCLEEYLGITSTYTN